MPPTDARPTAAHLRAEREDGYLPIESYGVIGDSRTLALVGADGSIDWMCLPNLDASPTFGALLDPEDGGRFVLAPAVPFAVERCYVKDTNVLQTDFICEQGSVRVTEAVTIDDAQNAPWRELVRRVEGLNGEVPMGWRFEPRFDFGRRPPQLREIDLGALAIDGDLQVAVRSFGAGEPKVAGRSASGSFTAREGQTALLALLASDDVALPLPQRSSLERRLEATVTLWRSWVERMDYEGEFKEAVKRSLMAIRLLADGRTGAITAAGTTSLPEVIGGKRNYDYRFGWVRDLSFTVDALLEVGMEELAHASVGWLLDAVSGTRPRVDPVYGLTAEVVRSQTTVPSPGWRRSAPVHVGNQAGSQLQLGGFGDLLETIHNYVSRGHILAPSAGERIADSVNLLCAIWRNEDAGLWELGESAHYATSKISCWCAMQRALELAERGQLPDRHAERWRRERDAIREFTEIRLFSERKGTYLMKAGSELLDCGVLLAARRGYLDPGGERFRGTIDAILNELRADGPLLYRYSGMQDEENAFLACSFWMVEALVLAGRREEGREMMSGLVELSGPLGLFSEEMEPGSHEMRGNFPQALTHLALINAAGMLEERSRP
jgi:GH15 family glucan-1,4-alpha-glucosidase